MSIGFLGPTGLLFIALFSEAKWPGREFDRSALSNAELKE